MKSINQVRNEIWSKYKEIISNDLAWLDFIEKSSYNYKYDFEDKIQLYNYKPLGKAFADSTFWNNYFKRNVKDDAVAIPLLNREKEKGTSIKYVYEVGDTTGNEKVPIFELDNLGEMALKEIIKDEIANKGVYDRIYNDVINRINRLQTEKGRTYTNENIKFIASSTAFATLSRLGLPLLALPLLEYILNVKDIENLKYLEISELMNESYKCINEFIKEIKDCRLKLYESSKEKNNEHKRIGKEDIRVGNVGRNETQIPKESQAEDVSRVSTRWRNRVSELSKQDSRTSGRDEFQEQVEIKTKTRNRSRTSGDRLSEIYNRNDKNRERSRTDSDEQFNISGREQLTKKDNEAEQASFFDDNQIRKQKEYDLGFYHMGNGLSVVNHAVLDPEIRDYESVAHINADRTIKFYIDELPIDVENEIKYTAYTSDMGISTTQPDIKVFSTPPLFNDIDLSNEEKEEIKGKLNLIKADEIGGKFSPTSSIDLQISRIIQREGTYSTEKSMGINRIDERDEQTSKISGRDDSEESHDQLNPIFPTETEQLEIIEEVAVQSAVTLSISQQNIDDELVKGSGIVHGKYRIYEYFLEKHSDKEKADFLKKEYGIGGYSTPNRGDFIDTYMHDGKGLHLSKRGENNQEVTVHLTWQQMARRIEELITLNRYVNESEKEAYQEYLQEKQEKLPKESILEGYKIDDMNLGKYPPKQRHKANIEAIKLLRELESDNRKATPSEKRILSEYTGFGAIPDAFDESKNNWRNEYKELKELLSNDEYRSAKASTLNSHYTSPEIIKEIYNVIEKMGFNKGRVLEPAIGVGNFIGMKPERLGFKYTGIEIDELSARMAKQIYDDSEIILSGFEDYNVSDNTFDLAIGNVPFGNYKLNDSRYDKNNFVIHDYFLAKSIDKVKPNGVIAYITSQGTMDKENTSTRRYIAQRADLLGAVRLPNDSFLENSGTKVTTDILFFQKRDEIRDLETDLPDWVNLKEDENGQRINAYYINNPENIAGTMTEVMGRYGKEYICMPSEDKSIRKALSKINTNIILPETSVEYEELEKLDIIAPQELRPYSYFKHNNEIYFKKESSFDVEKCEFSNRTKRRVEGMINIRDTLRDLIKYQSEDYPEKEIIEKRNQLNEIYDDFIIRFGFINQTIDEDGKRLVANERAFRRDVSSPLLNSIEKINKNGMYEGKADIFKKRTIYRYRPPVYAETAQEALAYSLNEKGYVDLDYMQDLTGLDKREIVRELDGVIYRNNYLTHSLGIADSDVWENGVFETEDEYLSGNIRDKIKLENSCLEIYKTDRNKHSEICKGIEKNIEALNKAIPKPIKASSISVGLGASWIPEEDIKDFIVELLELSWYYKNKINVDYSKINSKYNINNKRLINDNPIYGTKRMGAGDIIQESLNQKDCIVRDKVEVDGKIKYIINEKETLLAQQKQELIQEKFKEWIWKDIDRRERLEDRYNEIFNSSKARTFNGDHLTFPGMNNSIELRKHQKDVVARALYGGNTLMAHSVGAGKTYSMIAIAMEAKRLGLSNKSMIVVPNHLTEQWGKEFLELYPTANILIATKDDFTPAKRKEFVAKIAVGDYDSIIIGHSQFNKIPLSKERQEIILRNELSSIKEQIIDLKHTQNKSFSVKQLEQKEKELEYKLTKLLNSEYKDDVIDFEELGIDRLFVDESDVFKNLDTYTQMQNVAGLNSKGSLQAFDMYTKVQYINEITNYKGVCYATGTPISNSVVEMYTNQRSLQPHRLSEMGISNFDQWASVFAKTSSNLELKPEGDSYQLKTRLSGYKNIPELLNLFQETADIKTQEMLELEIPEVENITVVSDRSEFQKQYIESLGERAENVRTSSVSPEDDNMLKITTDGRNLALDQRMINPLLPDEENSKVNKCVQNIFELWEASKEEKSTQLVFSDIGTPSKTNRDKNRYCVYDDIKEKLIRKGIPENEIAFMQDAKTDKQKDKLFSEVREGNIRVLIGSTHTMGAGTNVQDRLIASHNLDCPWRPRDLEQRDGRIARQGNNNENVKVFRYVTKDTFDTYNYQLIETKQKFISEIMTTKAPQREVEDLDEIVLDYAQIKALTVGDPYIKEKMQLDIDIKKLKSMKSAYLSSKYNMEEQLKYVLPKKIEIHEKRLKEISDDFEFHKNNNVSKDNKDSFIGMEVQGILYKDRKEAGEALKKIIPKCSFRKPKTVARYKGFELAINFDDFSKMYQGTLIRSGKHYFELGFNASGNITRMDNVLNGLEKSLIKSEQKLNDLKKQSENIKSEVLKEFPKEKELNEKIERLKYVESKIASKKKKKEIEDVAL